jgi:putative ABC transport system ATP-binding protein
MSSMENAGDRGDRASRDERVIEVRAVVKHYRRGGNVVAALRGIDLTLRRGEFVAVMGASGSGKSTLLNLLLGLDFPTSGEIFVEGRALSALSDDQLTDLRRERIGVVFQFFHLLPNLTALDNVALPLRAAGVPSAEMRRRARRALEQVGLAHRAEHRPAELSGGEMQRVAVARALAIEPAVIVADEPTGNLDSETGGEILRLLQRCHGEGASVLMVTHSDEAAAFAERIVVLRDGAIVDQRTSARAAGTRRVLAPR